MPIEREEARELQRRLRGPVLLPGAPGFDEARSIWNAMIERRPAAVARCLGVADVAACVGFARDRGLALSVKGGGHNISGLAVARDGLMLDLSTMRGVWVDAEARRVRVQAGCLLGDVDRETQLHGLAAVLGFVSETGVAGLTLGGGFGYLTRRFGWTTDSLLSVDLVAADGHLVRASERENAELFWGLRGGGGNFGVATSFEYALHRVGPEIVGGAIAWSADEAGRVLALYRSLVLAAPPEQVLVLALRRAPPAPWLVPAAHGTPIVAVLVCDTGLLEQAERRAAPLKSFGAKVGDVVQRRPYLSQQSLLDATQPKGRRYYWKSEYLPAVEPEMLASAAEHAWRMASPHAAILIFPVGGAVGALPEGHTAAGNRNAAFVLNIQAAWERAEDDGANVEWARAAWRDLRRFSTGGTYVNFLTEDEGEERVRAAYGANHPRLVALKQAWDPGNLFRMNKPLAP